MKNNEKKDQRLELRLSKTEKNKIELLANKLGLSVSALIRNLVLVGYDTVKDFHE